MLKQFTVNAESQCPYFCDLETHGKDGYISDILKEFFKSEGHSLKINHVPYKRIFSKLKKDDSQLGVLPLLDINNHSDLKSFTFSIGINFSGIGVRTVKNESYISIHDLKGKKNCIEVRRTGGRTGEKNFISS